MKNFFTRGRIIMLIATIVLLTSSILLVFRLTSLGTDYTKEFNIYKQVESLNKLDEVRGKLQELKVEYRITDATVFLNGYNNISFAIGKNDTCCINSNSYMSNFKQLDTENRNVVSIYGVLENNKITEMIVISEEHVRFTKSHDSYYVLHTWPIYVAVILFFISMLLIGFMISDLILSTRNRKNTSD